MIIVFWVLLFRVLFFVTIFELFATPFMVWITLWSTFPHQLFDVQWILWELNILALKSSLLLASETLLLLQPIFDSIRNSNQHLHNSRDGSLFCSFPISDASASSSSNLFNISQKYSSTPKITLSHSHSTNCQSVSWAGFDLKLTYFFFTSPIVN